MRLDAAFVPAQSGAVRPADLSDLRVSDDGWAATIAYVSRAHGLEPARVERVRHPARAQAGSLR